MTKTQTKKKEMPRRFEAVLEEFPEIPEGREWMVILAHIWGRGETLAEAIKKAKEHGGRELGSCRALVYHVMPGAWVQGIGEICWDTKSADKFVEEKPVQLAKLVKNVVTVYKYVEQGQPAEPAEL